MDLITQLKVEDPSPNFRLFNEGIGGRIKVRAEDFQVEEIPIIQVQQLRIGQQHVQCITFLKLLL